jgi:hypothetical protein
MNLRYVVQVAVVFSPDHDKLEEFDLWELTLAFEAIGSREAINKAVSISRDILDHRGNWLALGYTAKPILYAVRSITSDIDFLRQASDLETITVLTKVGSFTAAEIEKLRSFQDVTIAYRVMYVDDQQSQ